MKAESRSASQPFNFDISSFVFLRIVILAKCRDRFSSLTGKYLSDPADRNAIAADRFDSSLEIDLRA